VLDCSSIFAREERLASALLVVVPAFGSRRVLACSAHNACGELQSDCIPTWLDRAELRSQEHGNRHSTQGKVVAEIDPDNVGHVVQEGSGRGLTESAEGVGLRTGRTRCIAGPVQARR
jgi:hypothetical protein